MGASCCHYMNCTDSNCFCGAYSNYKPNETPVCGAVAKTKFASKCYPKGGNWMVPIFMVLIMFHVREIC